MNITERASRDWANAIRDQHVEMREIRKEHDKLNRPLILAARLTGDQEPTAEPTGDDVTEEIKNKARELGYIEVGITAYDHRYTYQSKKEWIKFPHAICLAYEQDFEPTQTIPSIDAEIVHSSTYRTEGAAGLEIAKFIQGLRLPGAGSQPQRQHRALHPDDGRCRHWLPGRLRIPAHPARRLPLPHHDHHHRRQRQL